MSTTHLFSPENITPKTFNALLALYPDTVTALSRRKSSARTRKRPKPKSGKEKKNTDTVRVDVGVDIETRVREFLHLDEWRYVSLPRIVAERAKGKGGTHPYPDLYLEKEELVKLVEWKLKHGVFRPALLGMVKGNTEDVIRRATSAAFSALGSGSGSGSGSVVGDPTSPSTSTSSPSSSSGKIFPQESLEKLTSPLRGVGPATASLILSVATGDDVPFYSDDVYLWLCLGIYPSAGEARGPRVGTGGVVRPNGELNVKYNVGEYRRLWGAVGELRGRLAGFAGEEGEEEGEGVHVSCADVEKVALVLRYIDISGFVGLDGGDAAREKRKREEEEEEEEKEDDGGKKRGRRKSMKV